MRRMRFIGLAILFALTAAVVMPRPVAAPPAVSVQLIHYADLSNRVSALHGQIVVVDFWADYCLPCKREFPKLLELHRKYAGQGFTAISVSLDDPADAEARERVRRFLVEKQAAFANYLLDEKPEVWQTKLKIGGPPCVFVFDRRGRLVKKYHDHVDYGDIEKLVVSLLK